MYVVIFNRFRYTRTTDFTFLRAQMRIAARAPRSPAVGGPGEQQVPGRRRRRRHLHSTAPLTDPPARPSVRHSSRDESSRRVAGATDSRARDRDSIVGAQRRCDDRDTPAQRHRRRRRRRSERLSRPPPPRTVSIAAPRLSVAIIDVV